MKQETIEEAAHKMLDDYGIKSMGQSIGVLEVKKLMVKMAKWQAERRYSEEDMIKAVMFGELYQTEGSKSLFERKGTTPSQALVDFIDSFKNK
jgi:hypothetical protein